MNNLEAFGIRPGNDKRHLIMAVNLQAEDFFRDAEVLLSDVALTVLEQVVPNLEAHQGRWNAGGFMAFPLGMHDELGQLRLHVWPKGIERENSEGPNIHNHAWLLSSRVLAGVYSDTLYRVEDHGIVTDKELIKTEGLLQVFETRREPEGHNALITEGSFMKPIPILNRETPAERTNRTYLEMYHVTTVPVEQLAVTLILDSPALATTTKILIDSARIKSGRSRKVIDLSEIVLAKEQIMHS